MQSFTSQLLNLSKPEKQPEIVAKKEEAPKDHFSILGQLTLIIEEQEKLNKKKSFLKVSDCGERMLVVLLRYYEVIGADWMLGKDAAKKLGAAPTLFSRNMNMWSDMGLVEFDKSQHKKFKWRFTENGVKIAEDYKDELR